MRGIYDGSTTGKRPLLSRILNPFSDRSSAKKGQTAASPPADAQPLTQQQAEQKVMDDFVATIPGGLNADGTPKQLKIKPRQAAFLRLLADQNSTYDYTRPAPKAPSTPRTSGSPHDDVGSVSP